MDRRPSILVLAAGSLGDCVLTLPALRALKAKGVVTVAGTPAYQALGADLLGVDQVLPLDPILQRLYAGGVQDPYGPSFWEPFQDILLLFKDRDEDLEKALLPQASKLRRPALPFKEFLKEGRWVAEYWLEAALGEAASRDSPWRKAKLSIDAAFREKGAGILKSLGLAAGPLVIHPGSGSMEKNAPLPFFRKAAEGASSGSDNGVLVVWGEAEEGYAGVIRGIFHGLPKVVVLEKPLALRDLAAVLSASKAYLGNDSGVTQLASACGLRTFAVFNSTDKRIWGPQEAVILAAMKNLYE
jgi:ADP-heptose:LPS heptosyltransferase